MENWWYWTKGHEFAFAARGDSAPIDSHYAFTPIIGWGRLTKRKLPYVKLDGSHISHAEMVSTHHRYR